MDFSQNFSRPDTEQAWSEFVRWIGYSNLVKAVERKQASLTEMLCLEAVVPRIFSIEVGLSKIMKRWKSNRTLQFPKDKSIYDAYSFVGHAAQIKAQLDNDRAEAFRKRVIAEILPTGRLCNLEHEFRVALNLHQFGWEIFHSGLCGEPGPDFIARRGLHEIEVEAKCLSPEIGMSVSYGFVARLLSRIGRNIKGEHPGHFVRVQIQLKRADRQYDDDEIRRSAVQSYEKCQDAEFPDYKVTTALEPLEVFVDRFSEEFKQGGALEGVFAAERTEEGDYGYFARFDDELVFINLVPARENRQAKNVMKLISTTCERQFTKTRPGFLWLHLQALDANRFKGSLSEMLPSLERLARHTFGNNRRDHISSLIFSGDTELEPKRYQVGSRSARGVESTGYVKGFDNPRGKFPDIPAFAPLLQTTAPRSG
jgi:hypothetical protein